MSNYLADPIGKMIVSEDTELSLARGFGKTDAMRSEWVEGFVWSLSPFTMISQMRLFFLREQTEEDNSSRVKRGQNVLIHN